MKKGLLKKNKDGTVLFTVICVMMVLIVVLMSTFVVVAASQKKAMTSYTDSQSYITAKSVVDTFVKTLQAPPTASYVSQAQRNVLRTTLSGMPLNSSTDITVTLPSTVKGLGNLNKITVKRIDSKNFEVFATVTDAAGTSTSMVTQKLELTSVPKTTFPGAAVSFDSVSMPTGMSIFGGSYCKTGSTTPTNVSGTTGSQYLNGDIVIPDSGHAPFGLFNLGNGDSVVINKGPSGTASFKLDATVAINSSCNSEAKKPFFYVDGPFNLTTNYGFDFGSPGNGGFDILSKGASIASNNDIYGDIICDGNLSLSIPNGGAAYHGNIYVDGNISLNLGGSIDLSKLSGSTIHYGAAASAAVNSLKASVWSDPAKQAQFTSIFVDQGSAFNIDLNTSTTDTNGQKIISAGGKQFRINTDESVFKDYYDVYATDPKTGDEIMAGVSIPPTPVISGPPASPSSYSGTITASGVLPSGTYTNVEIQTGGADIYLTTQTGDYQGDITVTGGGKVTIYSPDDVSILGLKLLSNYTKNIIAAGDNFRVGKTPTLPAHPSSKIYWYMKNGKNMNLNCTGGAYPLIDAYIYGIGCNLNINCQGYTSLNVDDSGNVIPPKKISIIGSAVFGNITNSGGDTGIIYVPESSASPPGVDDQIWTGTEFNNNNN